MMEPVNDFCFSLINNLSDHDQPPPPPPPAGGGGYLPIRRFCQAARVEQQHQHQLQLQIDDQEDHYHSSSSSWDVVLNHLDNDILDPVLLLSPTLTSTSCTFNNNLPPDAANTMMQQEYQFVDNFFNIDDHINHNNDTPSRDDSSTHHLHLQPYDSFMQDVVDYIDISTIYGSQEEEEEDDHDNHNVNVLPMIHDHEYIDQMTIISCTTHEEDTTTDPNYYPSNNSILSSSLSSESSSLEPATYGSHETSTIITTTDHNTNINGVVDQGLQLVHLLLACAEAVGCRDTQLAHSILSQIWYSANPLGDSLQRVSYCFAMGLKSRLSLLHNNLNANGTISMLSSNSNRCCWPVANNHHSTDDTTNHVSREERMEAFHLLHRTTPYMAFGFMAANDAISQAARGKDRLHIIDLGMEHTLQWSSFIRMLASSVRTDPQVPPKVMIRITGIMGERGDMSELESSMKELVHVIANNTIDLEYRVIAGPATPSMLTRENLGIKEGEALFVNSILHLHTYVKESRGSLKTILQSIKKLGATLVTMVEQDANHNGPFFLGRFLESLHYYSAIFDSLEASGMGRSSRERAKIERNHYAEEIRNIVAYEGTERVERHERADQWRRQLGRAGFQVVGGGGGMLKESQARINKMISSNGDGDGDGGYTVGYDQKGYLLLGWKGRPIMLASAWQLPSA